MQPQNVTNILKSPFLFPATLRAMEVIPLPAVPIALLITTKLYILVADYELGFGFGFGLEFRIRIRVKVRVRIWVRVWIRFRVSVRVRV